MELQGKVAIVTGGARRLGRAISLALAEEGLRVAVHHGHSADAAAETVAAISELGSEAIAIEADLRDPLVSAETIVEQTAECFGRADILVNSAAVFEPSDLDSITEDEWERQVSINLKAPLFLSQAFTARLEPGRRAQIVNIVDWRATRPGTGHLIYTLTKSGLATLTRMLAQELAPDVQVNAVAPGAILPPPDKDETYLEALAENIPLRRTGSPQSVTEALLFLLRSDFVTGEVLHVTGGEHL